MLFKNAATRLSFAITLVACGSGEVVATSPSGTPSQLTCNIVTGVASANGPCVSPAATCNTYQQQTLTVAITTVRNQLVVSSNTFSVGDVGKYINIPDAVADGNGNPRPLLTRIAAVGSFSGGTQTVTLSGSSSRTFSTTSKTITWGKDDGAAFRSFRTWATANQGSQQVVLTIPTGSVCYIASFGSTTGGALGNNIFAGISNLIVEAGGATLTSVGGASFTLGGLAFYQIGLTSPQGKSARIQSVSAGSTTIALTPASYNAGYISRFSVGKTIMVGGLDLQGVFQSPYGFPPNSNYFEWPKISAICNNTAGCIGSAVITLDRPLVNSYSASWPEYNHGNNFEIDQGGPATIWLYHDSWEMTAEFRGSPGNRFTISQDGQTYSGGRSVTYRDVNFTGVNGAIPSTNESWSAINTSFGTDIGYSNMEVDKIIGTLKFDNVNIAKVLFQSTSTNTFVVTNSNITSELAGGAKQNSITDTTIANWGPGVGAYGSYGISNAFNCLRCTINVLNIGYGHRDNPNPSPWTMAGGTITMPLGSSNGPVLGPRNFVPEGRVYYSVNSTNPPTVLACCDTIGSFKVGTITSDTWPAVDNQAVSATVTSTNNSNIITVSGNSFSSGDIGKTIAVPGVTSGVLFTWIAGVSGSDPNTLTLGNVASKTQSSTRTLQWGTANAYVATDQAGSFPSVGAISSTPVAFKLAGAWNYTCDTCSGSDGNAYGSSLQAGAKSGYPLGAFLMRQYTPAVTNHTSMGAFPVRGLFKSLKVNVTAAASVGGSFIGLALGQFRTDFIDRNPSPSIYNWTPSSDFYINLKQTGERVITPSGVTCNTGGGPVAGACSGDLIKIPAHIANLWVQSGTVVPTIQSNASSGTSPTFTMTMTTDPLQ